mgnify:CR=1 FL=1
MKVVILAGGLGSRISEESIIKPKPLVEIGSKPIIWHIMKVYSQFGFNDFVICCGYKGYMIKEYFSNYFLHKSDVTFHMDNNKIEIHDERVEPWKVTLVDTGDSAMTGGRLLNVSKYIENEESFCFTYGDGVSDVNIKSLIDYHEGHGKLATVTAVSPPGRFGSLDLEKSRVKGFIEKPKEGGGKINGGFFVLSPKVLDYISGDKCVWEKEPLENLAAKNELVAFEHNNFWYPMDTLRDKKYLEDLWINKKAPWKTW